MKKSLTKILMILLVLALSLSVACKKPEKKEPEEGYIGAFLDTDGQFMTGLNKLFDNLNQEDPYEKLYAEATLGVKLALFDGAKLDYDIKLAASIQPHKVGTSNSEILVELTPAGRTNIILGLYLKDDLLYVVDGLTQKEGTNTFKVDIGKFAVGQYLDDLPTILYGALSSKEKEYLADAADGSYVKDQLAPIDTPIKENVVGWVTAVNRNSAGLPIKSVKDGKDDKGNDKYKDVIVTNPKERVAKKSIIDTIKGITDMLPMAGPILDGLGTLKGGTPDDDGIFPAGDYSIDLELKSLGDMIPDLLGFVGSIGNIGDTLGDLSGLLDAVLPLLLGDGFDTDVLIGLFADAESDEYADAIEKLENAEYPDISIRTKLEDDGSISSIGLYFNKKNTLGLDFSIKGLDIKFNKSESIVPAKVISDATASDKADGAIKVTLDLGIGSTTDAYALKADFYLAPGDFDLANATAVIKAVGKDGNAIQLEGGLYVDKNIIREETNTYATFLVFDMAGIYKLVGMDVPTGAVTKYKYEIFIDNILSAKAPVPEVKNAEMPKNEEAESNDLFDTLNKVGASITNILEILKGFKTDGMKITVDVAANDIMNVLDALEIKGLPDYSEGAVEGATLVINSTNIANFIRDEVCKFAGYEGTAITDANAIKVINALGRLNLDTTKSLKEILFGENGFTLSLTAAPADAGYNLTLVVKQGTTKIASLTVTIDIVEANVDLGVNLEAIYKEAASLNDKAIQTQIGDQFQAILDFLMDKIPA